MSILSFIIDIFLWLYIHGPIYQTESFIDDLQITPNPDSYLTPTSMIRQNGYAVETHTILTSDGFILAIDRIPNIGNKPEVSLTPILLIHGYLDSSAAWIADGPEEALAYLLADEGYDVWMINTRGNTFSRSHATYTPQERGFWNFSFHEIGVYDIPATIDFILKKTHQTQLLCVGDSAGNSEFYITLSVLPQYSDKIIAQISLAPFYFLSPQISSELIVPITNSILEYLYQHTPGSFLEHDLLTKLVIKILTLIQFFGYNLFDFILLITDGWLPSNINTRIAPIIYNTFPGGTSIKATQHLFQMKSSFSYFDYGPKENLKTYGTILPPKYNISNIHVPIRIYHSLLDDGSTPYDIQSLYDDFPMKAGLINVQDFGFTHLDFILNKNVKKFVYNDVTKFINHVLNNNTSSTT